MALLSHDASFRFNGQDLQDGSAANKGTAQPLFRFLLLTAQRNEDPRLARWEHLQNGIWQIPGENIKNGRDHSVALSPQALAVREPLRNRKSEWGVRLAVQPFEGSDPLGVARLHSSEEALRVRLPSA